ncbi:MAG TPA: beta-ketoacyl-ACP synthase III [Gammaproteobacteria bacterium]|nr:beta-ketoacyl-ACP synthase III [Gammaproteobacteria bacterium]
MSRHYSRIVGTGSYLPEKILTNRDLEATIDTSDEWIFSRTGIRQRHIAADSENTSDLALAASRRAITAAGIEPRQIGLIIVATTTPDMVFPSTACILQAKLGISGSPAFDVQAVCSGFIYGLSTADQFMRSGDYEYALVVGAEVYSRILDWDDRGTCVLFGDGAGAVVLKRSDTPGILSSHLHADGNYADILSVPGTVSGGQVSGRPLLQMEGNTVFRFAVRVLDDIVEETLAANQLQKTDVDWLIPHQANIRIIQMTAKKLGMSMEKVVTTVDRHANTSAASIPLALDEAVRDGRIRPGQHVLMEGVGGGFTWGAVLAKW